MAKGPEVTQFLDGLVSIECFEDRVRPWRLQHSERVLCSGNLAAMAVCAAVRIVLRSGGRTLRLLVSVPRQIAGLDEQVMEMMPSYPMEYELYLNGTFFAAHQAESATGTHFVEFCDLPSGEKELEVWLPPCTPLDIHAIDCGGDRIERPLGDKRPVFVCHGGSTVHGGPRVAAPSQTWPAACSRLADLRLVNLGFGGECFLDQVVARTIRDAACDCIALEFGTDVQPAAALTARTLPPMIMGFIQTIRDGHPDTPLVVVSALWSGRFEEKAPVPAPKFLSMAECREHLQSIVEKLRARGDKNIFYHHGLQLLGRPERHLLLDGLHPNTRGQLLMGQRFALREFGPSGRLLQGRYAGGTEGPRAEGDAGDPGGPGEALQALPGAYTCEGPGGERSQARIAVVNGQLAAAGGRLGEGPVMLGLRGGLLFPQGYPQFWGRLDGDAISFSDGARWTRNEEAHSPALPQHSLPPQRETAVAPCPEGQEEPEAAPPEGLRNAALVRTKDRGGLQYAVLPDGTGIRYNLLGGSGPCVVLIPGGQDGVCDDQLEWSQLSGLSELLQLHGFQVLLHDRRNTGASDVGYADGRATEAELQAEDLRLLLGHLGKGPAVLVGNSSGGRLALLLARRHPPAVHGLVLMNLTGGPVAARTLGQQYYRQYGSVAKSPGGMRSVCRSPHFSALCKANASNFERLSAMSPAVFAEAMRVSAEWLESSRQSPVLGHAAADLQEVKQPAKVLFSMHQANCQMHTLDVSRRLHAALPNAVGPLAECRTPRSLAKEVLEFITKLQTAFQ